ncbi:MAG: hypothetical protein K2Y12_11060 [Chitinophagaceae bacterium]|nr:hypothetical protein [Chitinophagaceae bacterium]
MRFILLLLLTIIIQLNVLSQSELPKVGTTKEEAFADWANNHTNEQWFIETERGLKIFGKFFKSTPVGLKHAFDEFERLKNEYKAVECIDKSLISNSAKDSKGNIDYERLTTYLKIESSEIVKFCDFSGKEVKRLALFSVVDNGRCFLSLKLYTDVAE